MVLELRLRVFILSHTKNFLFHCALHKPGQETDCGNLSQRFVLLTLVPNNALVADSMPCTLLGRQEVVSRYEVYHPKWRENSLEL